MRYTTDMYRTFMNFQVVNVTFHDAVNVIEGVFITANSFPYTAKLALVGVV